MATLCDLSKQFFDILEFDTDQTVEQKASDKRCFKNALIQFLEGGRKEDAFTVYFCFSEIFKLFGQGYDNTKKLLELLSDHEYHSGELLSKHRDHYSHSVYVFALGLSIYANDAYFRRSYLAFYGLKESGVAAFNFLKYWGMVALFHDIGYPFQLAHEQIKTYAEDVWGKDYLINPYVSYGNLQAFLKIEDAVAARLAEKLHLKQPITDLNALLAYGLKLREGYPEQAVCGKLYKRVVEQPYFMDHGYFSAVILAKHLLAMPNFEMTKQRLDIFTAILLHNNFNKYDAPESHPIGITEHPLAYLLILCDELQCWDRLAYGKISKRDPIAYDITLNISENRIFIKYRYDSYIVRLEDDKGKLVVKYNKNYSEMVDEVFVEKIFGSAVIRGEEYVKAAREKNAQEQDKKKRTLLYDGYIVSPLKLEVETKEEPKPKKSKLYASEDRFINICDLAKAIHASYDQHCKEYSSARIDSDFSKLSLEFKVSNIEQAKSYGEKLELVNCFYSSKDLDYHVVTDFKEIPYSQYKDNLEFLCREEHVRWVKEKLAMGWRYGTDYDENNIEERNRKKIHRCIVPYEELSDKDRSKDALMINNMLTVLKKFDSNIKIYSYRSGRKPDLQIAGVGHRFIKANSEKIEAYKREIKTILKGYCKDFHVIVRSCFAYGADQLIAECAIELGISVKADLPMEYEDFIADVKRDTTENGYTFTENDERRMRHLLAQTVVCKAIPDHVNTYAAASQYIIDKCTKLILLWDEKEIPLYDNEHRPINRGGTFDTLRMAREAKYPEGSIHIIGCQR